MQCFKLKSILVVIAASYSFIGNSISYAADDVLFGAEVSGNVAGEYRHFESDKQRSGQQDSSLSLSLEPEFYWQIEDSNNSVEFQPFIRIDETDSNRSHADVRELYWHHYDDTWEVKAGISQVFWGVTETIHLVNVINQTDAVENPDGESFLGQPMVNLTLIKDWGLVDFFVLPGFRERTFNDRDGRPGSQMIVSDDQSVYESSAEELHTDLAVRWSHNIESWDIGVSHFYGTSRAPRFSEDEVYLNGHNEVVYVPIYDIINQTGLDLQTTFDAWLLKLEVIHQNNAVGNFYAAAGGFEYTFYSVADSASDIGIIVEYLYDERDGEMADDDISVAVRWTLNDIDSTELLAGITQDVDNQSQYFFVEALTRIGNDFTLSLESRGVTNTDPDDASVMLKDSNYMQLELSYFF